MSGHAFEILWAGLGAAGDGDHELRWFADGERHAVWIPTADPRDRFDRMLRGLALQSRAGLAEDVSLSLLPRLRLDRRFVVNGAALWVRTESGEAVRRLEGFRAKPTLILHEGDTVRKLAIWVLSKEHEPERIAEANRRLAHALKCPKIRGRTDFMLPVPGSMVGRNEVVAEVVSGELWPAAWVVGGLQACPEVDPSKWNGRKAA